MITGATGFLGRHVRQRIPQKKYSLFLTSTLGDEKEGILKMDITDENQVQKVFSSVRPSIVVHLAAYVNLSRDYEVGVRCLIINMMGTLHVLEAAKENSIKKFILASTEEVYGDGSIPYKEEQMVSPPSLYAVSKLAAEQTVRLYSNLYNFSAIVFRIGTMYGPLDFPSRFIPSIIIKALQNKPIPIATGKKKRDYIYVEDAAKALFISIEKNLEEPFTVLNLGGGESYSLLTVIKKIISICRSKSQIQFNAMSERLLEADEWLLDNNKVKEILQWNPETAIDEGLLKTIDYYKNFKNGDNLRTK